MQEYHKGCKNIRAEKEHTTAGRTKQHEDEEDTGIRPARRGKKKGTKRETRHKRTKQAMILFQK